MSYIFDTFVNLIFKNNKAEVRPGRIRLCVNFLCSQSFSSTNASMKHATRLRIVGDPQIRAHPFSSLQALLQQQQQQHWWLRAIEPISIYPVRRFQRHSVRESSIHDLIRILTRTIQPERNHDDGTHTLRILYWRQVPVIPVRYISTKACGRSYEVESRNRGASDRRVSGARWLRASCQN